MTEFAEKIKSGAYERKALSLFIELADVLRTSPDSSSKLLQLTEALEQDELLRQKFRQLILSILKQSEPGNLFVETGMNNSSGFFSEISSRLGRKFLPPLENKQSIEYKLKKIFSDKRDATWMSSISESDWLRFFHALQFNYSFRMGNFSDALVLSLEQLSIRLSSLSLEKDIADNIDVQHDNYLFLQQNQHVAEIAVSIKDKESDEALNHKLDTLSDALAQCDLMILHLQRNISYKGTSLRQTFLIRRMEQHIARMRLLIDLMDEKRFEMKRFVDFLFEVVYGIQTRNSVWVFLSENVSTVAYQVAEQKGNTGEHYIANNRSEFRNFLIASCGGGLIISFVVIIKLLIHLGHFAPFWEAFAFSINYSIGFILIQVCGFTLATKQPAMTASAMAASMDDKKGGTSLHGLAIMTAKVFSSQTISFVGNLTVVFPLSLLLFYILQPMLGLPLIHDSEQAAKMYFSNHPFYSLSLFYAGITGVFLFLSGIISGYVDTKVIYAKIPQRVAEHPLLVKRYSNARLKFIADYLDHHLGSLVGNLSLGFFLGFASFFGFIFGLPFDIRHITIASGYFSISVYNIIGILNIYDILIAFIGVLGIGFVNFVSSFGLAFYVAVKSRNISLTDYTNYSKIVFRYFLKHPFDFIYPPAKDRTEEEIV
ncbi:MAG: hypothetical protein V4615_11100 [Bacteroidota bacterium]